MENTKTFKVLVEAAVPTSEYINLTFTVEDGVPKEKIMEMALPCVPI